MTRSRYRFGESEYPYFITNTIVAWLPIFTEPRLVDIVLDSWRFLMRERGVRIFGYVIMENHLHWIAAAEDLANRVGQFKSFTARTIIDTLKETNRQTILQELGYFKLRHKTDQSFQLWQEGSLPQQLRTEDMMFQKLEYMHNNPLRRGYIDEAIHWRYSSARNYAGLPGLLEVETDWQ